MSTIDGWYIPGGADIDPSNYGQDLHPNAKVGKYS
jgi:gamma-glutamyl-gamma-aminobutyrate hydrolase PuuD